MCAVSYKKNTCNFVDGLANLTYPERLKKLDFPTLAYRRKRIDLIELFKHFYLYDKFTLATSFKKNLRRSRKYDFQIIIPPERDGRYGPQTNFFIQRTARNWNNLPNTVVEAKNVSIFKKLLDKIWIDDPLKFDHKAN